MIGSGTSSPFQVSCIRERVKTRKSGDDHVLLDASREIRAITSRSTTLMLSWIIWANSMSVSVPAGWMADGASVLKPCNATATTSSACIGATTGRT